MGSDEQAMAAVLARRQGCAAWLDIPFKIAEVRQLSPDWGFARNCRTGTSRTVATGASVPGAQALPLLQKAGREGLVAHRAFCAVLPARAWGRA